MATRFWPGRSSSGRKLRPSMNRTPNSEKKLDETPAPANRAASLCPPRMKLDAKLDARIAAIPLNDRLASRQSTKFAGATSPSVPSRMPFPKRHDAVGLGIGQRLEQHRIAHAENRRIRPDPERQGHHGRRREAADSFAACGARRSDPLAATRWPGSSACPCGLPRAMSCCRTAAAPRAWRLPPSCPAGDSAPSAV